MLDASGHSCRGTPFAPRTASMISPTFALLMPAIGTPESASEWPVALLVARSGAGVVAARIDVRLARARVEAESLERDPARRTMPR